MKILVTGGAGFIASHIVDAYVRKGADAVVVDDLSSGKEEFINKNAVFYQEDIRNSEKISEIISKEKPEVINHHAAQISVRDSVDNPVLDAQVNLLGLINLLESAKKVKIKKIIFASSGGVVYGNAKNLPTPEKYQPKIPLSPYGVSKLASEHYLRYYSEVYKIPFIALRYANVYGPRQNPHGEAGVVAIFSLKLLKGEIPNINGDGLQTRDYCYVEDIVQANEKALGSKEVGSFNIGTGIETNVIEIFETIKESCKVNIQANFVPAKKGEQKRSCLEIKKAEKLLDWKPKFSLKEGIEKTVDYFKQHDE